MAKSFPNTGVTIIDSVSDLPGSPVEGLMVFQKDSNELKIFDGSSWVSVVNTNTPTGLVKLASGSFSNVSSVDVVSVFNANYTNYRIMYQYTGSANDNSTFGRMLNGTTPNTSSSYQSAWFGTTVSGTANNGVYTGAEWGYVGLSDDDANFSSSMTVDLLSPFVTGRDTVINTVCYGGQRAARSMHGTFNNTNSFDGFRWYNATSGTLSGVYTVYGYA